MVVRIQIFPGIAPVIFRIQNYRVIDFSIPQKLDHNLIGPFLLETCVFPDLQYLALDGVLIRFRNQVLVKFGFDQNVIAPFIPYLIQGRQHDQERAHLVDELPLGMAAAHHQVQTLFQFFRMIRENQTAFGIGGAIVRG